MVFGMRRSLKTFSLLCFSSCGIYPFNADWVNEHAALFDISEPLRVDAAAAASVSWPKGLSNTQLYDHLLGLARDTAGAQSMTMDALNLDTTTDAAVAELKADAGSLIVSHLL
jgi:hypothetical protein